MERKRNRLEVIRDILVVIQAKNGRIKPTQILYKSNLSHIMMQDYLQELISKGFIKESKTKEGRTYSITEKGVNYLREYNTIANFMGSFGLTEQA
jgi:predicted transcriptional regulator